MPFGLQNCLRICRFGSKIGFNQQKSSSIDILKVSKGAKIRNRYNQVPKSLIIFFLIASQYDRLGNAFSEVLYIKYQKTRTSW